MHYTRTDKLIFSLAIAVLLTLIFAVASCGRIDHRASGETTHNVNANATVDGEARIIVEVDIGSIEQACKPLEANVNKYSKCVADLSAAFVAIASSAGEE